MKTKISVNQNDVTVDRFDPFYGERTVTTYFVPRISNGCAGYVRIRDADGRNQQVCERLSGRGNTLMATPETLPAVIRRELRKLVRDEKRENQ